AANRLVASSMGNPHRFSAGSNVTAPSSTITIVGHLHCPTITKASNPAFLPAMAKCEEESASFRRMVNGDLATTANLAEVVSGVPTSGLKQKISAASEEKGSVPGWLS